MTVSTNKGRKPALLVFLVAPATGHMAPMLHIAREMIKRGFDAVFLTSAEFRASVEKISAEFWEQPPLFSAEIQAERNKTEMGPARLLFDLERIWIAGLPARHRLLKALLEALRRREGPDRPIVLVPETMSMAVLPFLHGAPLPEGYSVLPPTVAISVIPLLVSSMDTAPFGVGLPPDATASGRLRNQVLHQLALAPFDAAGDQFRACLADLGCTASGLARFRLFDVFVDAYDTTFQMCSPSLEYPRSDLAPSIRYAGVLPRRGLDPDLVYPPWWPEIAERDAGKMVVAVAQGTVATDYAELILPTIQGLAHRDDVVVVAILGVRGASLEEEAKARQLPSNTRVVDYLPYDAVLEHADVFVTNGGYGSVTHAVVNGVPMVVGGVTEDKVEVSARAEHAGLAVNLRTQTPSPGAVADAVDKVLSTPSYKTRAERLRLENEDLDALSIIERQLKKVMVA